MVIDSIILFIGIVNFLLTLFVFINAQKSKQHISFLVFAFIATFWLFDNFLQRLYPYSLFVTLSYGFGILVATSGLVWIYNLIEEKLPKFVIYFIVPLSIVVFFIASFTNFIQASFGVLGSLGSLGAQKGILFPEYSIYLAFLTLLCIYKLGKKYLQETDIVKKKRITYIFIGVLVFGLFSFAVDFFVPLFFNTFAVEDLVTLTYLPLLVFIFYSITKHKLFGVKIAITQFLVTIFLSLLLLNFLLSTSFNNYVWNGILLLASAFISYLILKNVFKEAELNKKLLEETQKNLNLEMQLKERYSDALGENMRKMGK